MNIAAVSTFVKDMYDRYGVYILGAMVLGFSSWYGYAYYRSSVEKKSFTQFAESIEDFYKLTGSSATKFDFENAEAGFAARAKSNKGSALAPYFVALQADAQLKEGRINDAIATYTQVLEKLPKDSPLAPLYTIKQALIQVDAPDADVQAQGMKKLQAIAADKKSPVQDMALYYLGYFAWVLNDITTTENYFRTVIVDHKDSVWAKMALAKLEATA